LRFDLGGADSVALLFLAPSAFPSVSAASRSPDGALVFPGAGASGPLLRAAIPAAAVDVDGVLAQPPGLAERELASEPKPSMYGKP